MDIDDEGEGTRRAGLTGTATDGRELREEERRAGLLGITGAGLAALIIFLSSSPPSPPSLLRRW